MAWYDNIYKIEIEKTDLGVDFNIRDRNEYRIVVYDKDNNSEILPGYFSSMTGNNGAKVRVKEIAEIVNKNTKNNCVVDFSPKKVSLEELSSVHKERIDYKMRKKIFELNSKIIQKRNDNLRYGGKDYIEK